MVTSVKRTLGAAIAIFVIAVYPQIAAYADVYDDQIKALQNQVDQAQAQAAQLHAQADTLQNAVNALDAQKRAIQAQIDANQVKLDQLNQQIQETEHRIDNQRIALGSNLRSMYLESSVTSLEMVASSKSISDFVDKEEYRSKIRDHIQQSLTEIKQLKQELGKQKNSVERVLADQSAQRNEFAAKESEQASLLSQTQGQEASYQQLSQQRNAQIAVVKEQQRIAYASYARRNNLRIEAGDPGHGGYPNAWAYAPQDSIVDNWGMYNRECVSYAAFRVSNSGHYMPYWGGRGDAYQWPGNARAAGIQVDSNPAVGSVAIWGIEDIGGVGHAAYVEKVYGNGTIRVSQYNYGVAGTYSEMDVSAGGLDFIHF